MEKDDRGTAIRQIVKVWREKEVGLEIACRSLVVDIGGCCCQ